MTTRHSIAGSASSASTPGTIFPPPACPQTARRPPNSGMVCASSPSRVGSALKSSASSRASANGSLTSSTDALIRVLTRSLTRPASGPNTRTTGRAGSGRATKLSTSAALIATMFDELFEFEHDLIRKPVPTFRDHALGAGDEVRRQPVPDGVGDDLGGAVFGIALRALLGEALRRAGNIVIDMGKGLVGQDDFAGCDFDELIIGDDGIDLRVRP